MGSDWHQAPVSGREQLLATSGAGSPNTSLVHAVPSITTRRVLRAANVWRRSMRDTFNDGLADQSIEQKPEGTPTGILMGLPIPNLIEY